jgi:proteic killer suppression protein
MRQSRFTTRPSFSFPNLSPVTCLFTLLVVIRSFRHKGLKRLFETGDRRGVSAALADRLRRQLDVLNRARTPGDCNLPGYRLHQLKGGRAGNWSLSVSGNWRITFKFADGDATDVYLEDYH